LYIPSLLFSKIDSKLEKLKSLHSKECKSEGIKIRTRNNILCNFYFCCCGYFIFSLENIKQYCDILYKKEEGLIMLFDIKTSKRVVDMYEARKKDSITSLEERLSYRLSEYSDADVIELYMDDDGFDLDININDYVRINRYLAEENNAVADYLRIADKISDEMFNSNYAPIVEVNIKSISDVGFRDFHDALVGRVAGKVDDKYIEELNNSFALLKREFNKEKINREKVLDEKYGRYTEEEYGQAKEHLDGLPDHIAYYVEVNKDKLSLSEKEVLDRVAKSNSYPTLNEGGGYIFSFNDKGEAQKMIGRVNSFLDSPLSSSKVSIHPVEKDKVLKEHQKNKFLEKILGAIEEYSYEGGGVKNKSGLKNS